MTTNKPEIETYEPTFDELSDEDSPHYDTNWYESDLLPHDHDWYEIIGDFLYMKTIIQKYKYTGKNDALLAQNIKRIEIFEKSLEEVEFYISNLALSTDFVQNWGRLYASFQAMKFIKSTERQRISQGKYDRRREERRAWYSTVFLIEQDKGLHAKEIRYRIAKFAELIKAGQIQPHPLWVELKFEKLLHKTSTLKEPKEDPIQDAQIALMSSGLSKDQVRQVMDYVNFIKGQKD